MKTAIYENGNYALFNIKKGHSFRAITINSWQFLDFRRNENILLFYVVLCVLSIVVNVIRVNFPILGADLWGLRLCSILHRAIFESSAEHAWISRNVRNS
jgi:hypothetical protein